MNSTTERSDHANAIDQSIGMMLINKVANDGSPIVRMVRFCLYIVFMYQKNFDIRGKRLPAGITVKLGKFNLAN